MADKGMSDQNKERKKRFKGTIRTCEMCKKKFEPSSYYHIFCGNKKDKTSCSYKNQQMLSKKWAKEHSEEIKTYQRDRQRKWLGWTDEEIKLIEPNLGNRSKRFKITSEWWLKKIKEVEEKAYHKGYYDGLLAK